MSGNTAVRRVPVRLTAFFAGDRMCKHNGLRVSIGGNCAIFGARLYSLLRGRKAPAAIYKWRSRSARTRPRLILSIQRAWTSWWRRPGVLRARNRWSFRSDDLVTCGDDGPPKTVSPLLDNNNINNIITFSAVTRCRCVPVAADRVHAGIDLWKIENTKTHAHGRANGLKFKILCDII